MFTNASAHELVLHNTLSFSIQLQQTPNMTNHTSPNHTPQRFTNENIHGYFRISLLKKPSPTLIKDI
jgi:hypothetical protein